MPLKVIVIKNYDLKFLYVRIKCDLFSVVFRRRPKLERANNCIHPDHFKLFLTKKRVTSMFKRSCFFISYDCLQNIYSI